MDEEDVREYKMVTSIMRVIAIEKEFVTRNLRLLYHLDSLKRVIQFAYPDLWMSFWDMNE